MQQKKKKKRREEKEMKSTVIKHGITVRREVKVSPLSKIQLLSFSLVALQEGRVHTFDPTFSLTDEIKETA